MNCSECGHTPPVHSLSCGRRFGLITEDGDGAEYLKDLNVGHGSWDIEPAPWSSRNLNAGY